MRGKSGESKGENVCERKGKKMRKGDEKAKKGRESNNYEQEKQRKREKVIEKEVY